MTMLHYVVVVTGGCVMLLLSLVVASCLVVVLFVAACSVTARGQERTRPSWSEESVAPASSDAASEHEARGSWRTACSVAAPSRVPGQHIKVP